MFIKSKILLTHSNKSNNEKINVLIRYERKKLRIQSEKLKTINTELKTMIESTREIKDFKGLLLNNSNKDTLIK